MLGASRPTRPTPRPPLQRAGELSSTPATVGELYPRLPLASSALTHGHEAAAVTRPLLQLDKALECRSRRWASSTQGRLSFLGVHRGRTRRRRLGLGIIRSLGLIHGGGELPLRGKCGARHPRPRHRHLRKLMPCYALEATASTGRAHVCPASRYSAIKARTRPLWPPSASFKIRHGRAFSFRFLVAMSD